jgi:lipopolysaccharide transport system permease protein
MKKKPDLSAANEWFLTIKPKRSLLEVNIKELWLYRDLISLFIRRDLVARFKQTILGPLWFIIQPLLTSIIFTVVFGNIAGIPTDGLPKMLFYMSGVVLWTYFSQCLTNTSNTFVQNANIFGKVYFPRLAVPISIIISTLINFVVQFLFLICFIIYFRIKGVEIHSNISVLLLPLIIIITAGLSFGFGIIFSSLTTKYRDLKNLLAFGIQLWMYASPIVYPLSEIPAKYQWISIANPITPLIESFRFALLGAGTLNLWHLLYSFGFMIFISFIGIIIFNQVEKNFMDTV